MQPPTTIQNRAMLFEADKALMDRPVLVESKNTGRQWRMEPEQLPAFMTGRWPQWYRVFDQRTST